MKRIPLIYIAIGCYRKAKLQEEVGPSLGKFLWSRILIQDVDATNSGVHDVGTSTWDRASLDVPIKTDQPEIFFQSEKLTSNLQGINQYNQSKQRSIE